VAEMNIAGYLKAYQDLSGKASDVSRQLCFAGIGLVWIFKQEKANQTVVAGELHVAAAALAIALTFDLLQYIYSAAVWGAFHRIHEHDADEEKDIQAPIWFNWPTLALYWGKLLFAFAAYIVIIEYLVTHVK
jgi:hypothetical protein